MALFSENVFGCHSLCKESGQLATGMKTSEIFPADPNWHWNSVKRFLAYGFKFCLCFLHKCHTFELKIAIICQKVITFFNRLGKFFILFEELLSVKKVKLLIYLVFVICHPIKFQSKSKSKVSF